MPGKGDDVRLPSIVRSLTVETTSPAFVTEERRHMSRSTHPVDWKDKYFRGPLCQKVLGAGVAGASAAQPCADRSERLVAMDALFLRQVAQGV
jgi:hypothetical protein